MKKIIGFILTFCALLLVTSCKSDLKKIESKLDLKYSSGWYGFKEISITYDGDKKTIYEEDFHGYLEKNEQTAEFQVSKCLYETSKVFYDNDESINNEKCVISYNNELFVEEKTTINDTVYLHDKKGTKDLSSFRFQEPFSFVANDYKMVSRVIDIKNNSIISQMNLRNKNDGYVHTFKLYFDKNYKIYKTIYICQNIDTRNDNENRLYKYIEFFKAEEKELQFETNYTHRYDANSYYIDLSIL